MMMVNTSETCAITRLIQCRYLGGRIFTNDTRKFQQHPENAPDLSTDEFLTRKVLRQVSSDKKGQGEWAPILYRYEVCLVPARV